MMATIPFSLVEQNTTSNLDRMADLFTVSAREHAGRPDCAHAVTRKERNQ